MPRYGRKRLYSKPFRRYGKKYGRARWKNKKFSKYNNKTRASIRGLIMPKSAYVKLPWREIATTGNIGVGSSTNIMWVPTAYIPRPTDYTTDANRVEAQAGDRFTNGITNYASFFDNGYVLGASIKLQILPRAHVSGPGDVSNQLLAILVSYPYNGLVSDSIANPDISQAVRQVYDYLGSLTNDNLQSLAYAQSRVITLPNSKGEIFMKMFRKTKQMTGVKDIEDNDDMEINIPQDDLDYSNLRYGAAQGFIYYLRLVNLAGTTNSQSALVNTKITQYWKLTSRRAVLQTVATDPEP